MDRFGWQSFSQVEGAPHRVHKQFQAKTKIGKASCKETPSPPQSQTPSKIDVIFESIHQRVASISPFSKNKKMCSEVAANALCPIGKMKTRLSAMEVGLQEQCSELVGRCQQISKQSKGRGEALGASQACSQNELECIVRAIEEIKKLNQNEQPAKARGAVNEFAASIRRNCQRPISITKVNSKSSMLSPTKGKDSLLLNFKNDEEGYVTLKYSDDSFRPDKIETNDYSEISGTKFFQNSSIRGKRPSYKEEGLLTNGEMELSTSKNIEMKPLEQKKKKEQVFRESFLFEEAEEVRSRLKQINKSISKASAFCESTLEKLIEEIAEEKVVLSEEYNALLAKITHGLRGIESQVADEREHIKGYSEQFLGSLLAVEQEWIQVVEAQKAGRRMQEEKMIGMISALSEAFS